jgi:hypothetical protein
VSRLSAGSGAQDWSNNRFLLSAAFLIWVAASRSLSVDWELSLLADPIVDVPRADSVAQENATLLASSALAHIYYHVFGIEPPAAVASRDSLIPGLPRTPSLKRPTNTLLVIVEGAAGLSRRSMLGGAASHYLLTDDVIVHEAFAQTDGGSGVESAIELWPSGAVRAAATSPSIALQWGEYGFERMQYDARHPVDPHFLGRLACTKDGIGALQRLGLVVTTAAEASGSVCPVYSYNLDGRSVVLDASPADVQQARPYRILSSL